MLNVIKSSSNNSDMMIASEGSGGGTSDNEANSPQTTTSFSNLPIEIVFKIIDLLPIKSILSLRAVDKQFNELVDTYTRFWRKLNYRLDLDKLAKNNALTTGLDSFEIFLNRIAPISIIDVKCESVLTRENKIELNLRHRKNGGALRTNRTFAIRTRELNIASTVHFLNLISNSCSKLVIESFFKSNPRQGSFNKFENQKCHRFEHLTCLDLNCATFSNHHDGSLKQEFRNINNICIDQLVDVFPSLVHLHLQHYNDSAYELYQKLARLPRLKLIEFYQVSTHASFNLNWELQVFEKNLDQPFTPMKLKVENYMFRSTRFETIQLYLAHFSDISHLTSLSLFRIDLASKANFSYLMRLLSSGRASNLRTLSTDMLQSKNLVAYVTQEDDEALKSVLARLDTIYLCECESIYDALESNACASKLKKRNCFYSSYDYSFSLYDFNRLFADPSLTLSARKIVILFAHVSLCDPKAAKSLTDAVLGVLRLAAKSLTYLELRFKCSHCNKYFVKYFNNFQM